MDLYMQLCCVQPGGWGSSHISYGIRYNDGQRIIHESGKSWFTFDGKSNREELRARLSGVFIRYNEDAAKGCLPRLERHRIDVELGEDAQKQYNLALRDIVGYAKAKKEAAGKALPPKVVIGGKEFELEDQKPKALQLVATSALKSILDLEKQRQAPKVVLDLLQKHRRLVVFTWKIDAARQLAVQLEEFFSSSINGAIASTTDPIEVVGPIDGGDPWHVRRKLAQYFANLSLDVRGVFVATRGSCGIAINDLACADAVLQTTPDWNPDGNLQVEKRVHRQGNMHEFVNSYFMLAKGTLDDRVLELMRMKSDEAASVSCIDTQGRQLVQDLDPDFSEDEDITLEQLLAIAGSEVRWI
jgi:hypothetical protein